MSEAIAWIIALLPAVILLLAKQRAAALVWIAIAFASFGSALCLGVMMLGVLGFAALFVAIALFAGEVGGAL